MSKYTEEELNQALEDTGRLLKDVPLTQEYDLDDILAEFGTGAVKPRQAEPPAQPDPEPVPPAQVPEVPVTEPDPEEEPAAAEAEKPAVQEEPAAVEPDPEKPGEDEPSPEDLAGEEAPEEPPKEDIPAPEEEPPEPEEEAPPREHLVSLEDMMDRTVSAVMEEESAQRQLEREEQERQARRARRAALCRARLAAAGGFFRALTAPKARPEPEPEEEEVIPPEPDMAQAEFEQKRLCRLHRGTTLRCLLPAILLVGLTAAEALVTMPALWTDTPALRFGAVAALLLAQTALALPLWRDMAAQLRQKCVSCAWGALLLTLACLGDCAWCIAKGGEHLPLAGAAALVTLCCEWGVYLRCAARRESFRLADLGGHPPWSVQKTEAGAIKCQGRLEGFYTHTLEPDMPQKWHNAALPLLLATACVLAGVVCLSEAKPAQPLWVWSALLAAATPLSWPLAGTLPTYFLSRRLSHSGCAVAGYSGAKAVSGAKRMVITDEDLYPAGTLSLNGMKIYGEELGRVLSYAVAVARAADSQALPLLEQMLSDQGGQAEKLDGFHWYEEGGAGGTIHGETVLLGSAYFMRRQNVRLPRELKVPSGLFLAVDGQLTAIFALRYQPSRNVDWALRALRRNRVTPVLAVRGSNITPEFLRRSFKVDAKPIYPDVQTRLSLLEQARQTGPAYALIYRDGLMPYAETVLGSRKLLLAARWSTALALLASAAGLLLCYYLTGIGGYASLTPLRLVLFQLLWLLPGLLLAGQVKHF